MTNTTTLTRPTAPAARPTCTVEAWAMVDSEGNYAVGSCPQSAREAYVEQVRPLDDCDGFRLVRLTVKVPLPEVVELVGEAPEFGNSELTEVQ